jgi:hypothetical protein
MHSPEIKQGRGFGVVKKLKEKTSLTGESKFYYILYSVNGRKIKENTKTDVWQEAYDLLVQRKMDAARGAAPAKSQVIFRYEHMRELLLQNYEAKNRGNYINKAGVRTFRGHATLDAFFGGMAVSMMDSEKIGQYVERCRAEGFEGPTIRRHLDCLGKMFTLAKRCGKIQNIPYIEKPAESEPAGIVIDPEDFDKIMANTPEVYRPFFIFQNQTACRLGATRQITWAMLDKACTQVCLPAAIIKTRKPLTLPLKDAGPEMEKLSALLQKADRSLPVFHSEDADTDYLEVWQKACIAAGVAHMEKREGQRPLYVGPRVHDNRVAGARALVQSGVDQDTAMKVGGWRTPHVFSRYNIVTTGDIAAALRKRANHAAAA